MKICGIPIPEPSLQAPSATGLPLLHRLVHAVEQGAERAECGVEGRRLELWDEPWPGKRLPDMGRCETCRIRVSQS